MLFIALMFITTSCVAGAAAFFSVYGLAHTFAASFWSVVFMGGALEAGKLMTASYLYRYAADISRGTKVLGYIFVFCLMMLTSLGIYGYLADAYQSGSTDMKQVNASLDLKKQEQATLQKRKSEIDAQIAAVPATDTRGKQRVMKQFGGESDKVNARLSALSAEIQQDAQKQITTDSHVGPIVFVAKIVGMEPDHAISLLILLIIFAFDPLAIYLTIATNNALAKRNKEQATMTEDIPHPDAPVTEPTISPVVEEVTDNQPDDFDPSDWVEVSCEDYVPVPVPEAPIDLTRPAKIAKQPDMKVLGELFSNEDTEDVAAEEGTEAPPIQQLAKIYEEVAAKDETEQTPVDIETLKRIERFFARQDLIKNVRSGSVE